MSSPWRPRRCPPSAAERPTPDRRQTFARRGERLAAWYLRLKGYRIEARNWRCPQGEMDIIAWDGDTLVFVEVKARASGMAGTPEEAVDARKQQRLIRIASVFLAGRRGAEPPCRFDVIAIRRNGMRLAIRHLRSAFRADP